MSASIVIGSRVPDVRLGYCVNGEIHRCHAAEIFAGTRAIVIGVPGAFTPVCSRQHLPDYVENAASLRASGFDQLICIAANDPFVVERWALSIDPQGRLRFLSAGNLDFATALGLQMVNREMFMAGRSERYLMVVDKGLITHIRVEPNIHTYSCTRTKDVTAFV